MSQLDCVSSGTSYRSKRGALGGKGKGNQFGGEEAVAGMFLRGRVPIIFFRQVTQRCLNENDVKIIA